MEKPESLIDDKTLEIFGTSSSLDVNMLIKNIELLEKHLPNVNNEKNFFGDAKKEFIRLNSSNNNLCCCNFCFS